MADELQIPVGAPAPAKPHQLQIRDAVKDSLVAHGSERIRGMVIGHLTEVEITRRKDAVLIVLTKLDESSRNINKLESQGETKFDHRGDVIGVPGFTKAQIADIKQAKEAYEKLQRLLANAFEKDEWNKLIEASKQNSGGSQNNTPTAAKD